MSLRDTEEYKSMTPYLATGLAEGFIEADSEEQVLTAFQYIHDKGMTAYLQGFFGRTCRDLIEGGLIDA